MQIRLAVKKNYTLFWHIFYCIDFYRHLPKAYILHDVRFAIVGTQNAWVTVIQRRLECIMIRLWNLLRSKYFASIVITTSLLSVIATETQAAPIPFQLVYTDPAGVGFNDVGFGDQAHMAVETAKAIFNRVLAESYIGETITVAVEFEFIPGSFSRGGFNPLFPTDSSPPPGFFPQTLYPSILVNHLTGADLLPPSLPGSTDFRVQFGLNVPWSFNLGGAPSGQFDFINFALHEFVHGLGFLTAVTEDGTFRNGLPLIYDRFVVDELGTPITSMTDAERLAAVSDPDGLFWSGINGINANGGVMPLLLASADGFIPGLSVVHTNTFEQTGRTNVIMEACGLASPGRNFMQCTDLPTSRSIDDITLGMLQDIGWSIMPTKVPTKVPEPGSFMLLLIGLTVLVSLTKASRSERNV